MKEYRFLGFDFGASSGRAMLGVYDGTKLTLEEIRRFSNDPVELCGRMVWDLPRLFFEMKQSLTDLKNRGIEPDAIGIDTWGVDFGLLDKNGNLIGIPIHYRDRMTEGVPEKVWREEMPKEELFSRTGIAFNQFNTLYQLCALRDRKEPALEIAEDLLFMPDLLAYLLTGEKGTEYTIASTAQMLDPVRRDWDRELAEKLGIPTRLLGRITPPGTVRGTLLPQIAEECGIGRVPVIAVGSHDTASAVAAVPAEGDRFAYLSSGTWSLLGAEIDAPLLSREVMEAGYTNEGGVCGKIRLLKNIMGLWIINECQRVWARHGEEKSIVEIVELAQQAEPFRALIDVNDPRFLAAGDMPERIRAYCRETGQKEPEGIGGIARTVFESLALEYRRSLNALEKDLLGFPAEVLHIVGGGGKNVMLNRFTANAIGRPVVTGPFEATVIGNLMLQAMAVADVKDLAQLRRVVAASFPTERFEPEEDLTAWEEAYARFSKLVK